MILTEIIGGPHDGHRFRATGRTVNDKRLSLPIEPHAGIPTGVCRSVKRWTLGDPVARFETEWIEYRRRSPDEWIHAGLDLHTWHNVFAEPT